jgi:hypothetical protein
MPRKLAQKEPEFEPGAAAFKMPKTLGACADLFYQTQNKRLALQREVDKIQALETAISDHIIAELPKSDANGIAGKLCRVTIRTSLKPRVVDWDKLYAFILKTKDFSVLQRRPAELAIKERWDENIAVPGVEPFKAVKLSIAKI